MLYWRIRKTNTSIKQQKKEMAANLKHGELLFDTLKLKLQYSVLQIIETI
jgi:hypothetical protein